MRKERESTVVPVAEQLLLLLYESLLNNKKIFSHEEHINEKKAEVRDERGDNDLCCVRRTMKRKELEEQQKESEG